MKKDYQIHIDRLEVTYNCLSPLLLEELSRTDARIDFDGFWLIRQESRNYRNEFAIWFDDHRSSQDDSVPRILGYLYFGSYNPNRQSVYISYVNQSFYEWSIHCREYIEIVLDLEFMAISKLDLAVDFNFNVQRCILKAYKDLDYEVIINDRKRSDDKVEGVGVVAQNNPRKRLFANPEFFVANKDKTFALKSYNKTKEIEDSYKEYISVASGFRRMYRLEVSCQCHKVLVPTFKKIGMTEEDIWGKILMPDMQLRLFVELLYRLIRFRKGRKVYSLLELALNI